MKYKLLKDSITNIAGDIFELGIPQAFKKHYVCSRNEKLLWDAEVENNPEWFASFLFTTQDNVDIYGKEVIYALVLKDYNMGLVKKDSILTLSSEATMAHWNNDTWLIFSTKQAALIYLAKQKYPVGTKVKCLFMNRGETITSHEKPTISNGLNYIDYYGQIWLNAGDYNVMVYKDGKWAEIVPQFEVGKWYSVNKGDEFIKFSSSDKEAIYGEGITKKHLKFQPNWWIYFNHIKNYELLTDLSVIQPYLPDNHVDKVPSWWVGDIIAVKGTNIVAKITKIEDYYVSTDYMPAQDYRFLGIRKATESEIIAYYEKLGWVKGAKCCEVSWNIYTVDRLEVIDSKVIVHYSIVPEVKIKDSAPIDKLQLYKQPELPKSWEELRKVGGFYIDKDSDVIGAITSTTYHGNKNLFKTEKQAESALAFAQLSQLVAKYNDGWVADWNGNEPENYCIVRKSNKLCIERRNTTWHSLPFKSKELAELSLKHHNNLWKTYYEL